jgi:hypothetical protein
MYPHTVLMALKYLICIFPLSGTTTTADPFLLHVLSVKGALVTCCIISLCFMILTQGLSRTGQDHVDNLSTTRYECPSNYKFIQALISKPHQTNPAPPLAHRTSSPAVFGNLVGSEEETGPKLRLRFPSQRVGAVQPRHEPCHGSPSGIRNPP